MNSEDAKQVVSQDEPEARGEPGQSLSPDELADQVMPEDLPEQAPGCEEPEEPEAYAEEETAEAGSDEEAAEETALKDQAGAKTDETGANEDDEASAPAVGVPEDLNLDDNPDLEDEEESHGNDLPVEAVVEALIFASPQPLSAHQIMKSLKNSYSITVREVQEIVNSLNQGYHERGAAFEIVKVAEEFRFMTKPEFSEYLGLLRKAPPKRGLTPAALQALAIIAYRQPITKADIEGIRGVRCGQLLRTLLEKDLIKIVGMAKELGNPRLYGTTKKFLELFGIGSIKELPRMEDYEE